MARKQVPFVKKVEVIHQQIHSYANDLENIMNGLEEYQNSQNVQELQNVIKESLSDLDSLYCEFMGSQDDEELSEAFHRAQLP